MKRILIIGAGGQGGPCASILSRIEDVSEIRLGDINTELAQKVAEKIGGPKVKPLKLDAESIIPDFIRDRHDGKKSDFPSPCGRGLGEGVQSAVYHLIHPHPVPLPSRERELFRSLGDQPGLMAKNDIHYDAFFKANNRNHKAFHFFSSSKTLKG